MKAHWGWRDTKAKLLTSPSLMSEWGTIENLRDVLTRVFDAGALDQPLSQSLCNAPDATRTIKERRPQVVD